MNIKSELIRKLEKASIGREVVDKVKADDLSIIQHLVKSCKLARIGLWYNVVLNGIVKVIKETQQDIKNADNLYATIIEEYVSRITMVPLYNEDQILTNLSTPKMQATWTGLDVGHLVRIRSNNSDKAWAEVRRRCGNYLVGILRNDINGKQAGEDVVIAVEYIFNTSGVAETPEQKLQRKLDYLSKRIDDENFDKNMKSATMQALLYDLDILIHKTNYVQLESPAIDILLDSLVYLNDYWNVRAYAR